jgi:uncharacterized membrane protein YqaE (UPF0057 family)
VIQIKRVTTCHPFFLTLETGNNMLYILALFLPFLAVMLKGRIIVGVVLLVLQITLIGWLPATIVACFIINNENNKKHIEQAIKKNQPMAR